MENQESPTNGQAESQDQSNKASAEKPNDHREGAAEPNGTASTEPNQSQQPAEASSSHQNAEQAQSGETFDPQSRENKNSTNNLDDAGETDPACKKQNRKAPAKGFGGENQQSTHPEPQNPFSNRGTSQGASEGKFYDPSFSENKYRDSPTQLLEDLLERRDKKIKPKQKEYDVVIEKINNLVKEKREEYSYSKTSTIDNAIEHKNEELYKLEKELEDLQADAEPIREELKRRNRLKNKYSEAKNGTDAKDFQEDDENISASSLFEDDEPIKNIILYVVTFFPDLNPQDFKRIVSLLLEGKKTSILVKDSISTKEGETQTTEVYKEEYLTKIWQESFDKPDRYLKNCYLKVYRNNGSPTIDFFLPKLRQDILAYFEEKQPLYLEEQLERTQKLKLFFDSSEDVAEQAINVAVKAAIYYPETYNSVWLIDIFNEITGREPNNTKNLIKRIKKLIYLLQLEPKYSQSDVVVQNFFEYFLVTGYQSHSGKVLQYIFEILHYLIDQHLISGLSIGQQSAKQLLNSLQKISKLKVINQSAEQLLNSLLEFSELENKDEQANQKQEIDIKIQAYIYNLLDSLLWRSRLFLYTYDLLKILKDWLPEKSTPPEEYLLPHKIALLLFFTFCKDTTRFLPLRSYGDWPSVHPLFAPLRSGFDDDNSEELKILTSWLFYSDLNGNLALSHVFLEIYPNYSAYIDFLMSEASSILNKGQGEINPIEQICFFISEWLAILFGFEAKESDQDLWNLVDLLICSLLENTTRAQENQLAESWTIFIGRFLDIATFYADSNNKEDRDFRKQFNGRRKLLKKFKKQFRVLRKEAVTRK